MPEPFSYHMATAYQKAFKEFLTYTRLYETLVIQYLVCDSRKKVLLFSTNDLT